MRLLRNATVFLLSVAALGCAGGQSMILEAKDVQFFKTSVSYVGGDTRLKISGLAFHSALAVETLQQKEEAETLHLLITLVPARPGLSGTFNYTIEVPPEVTHVTFGTSETVIWQRP